MVQSRGKERFLSKEGKGRLGKGRGEILITYMFGLKYKRRGEERHFILKNV